MNIKSLNLLVAILFFMNTPVYGKFTVGTAIDSVTDTASYLSTSSYSPYVFTAACGGSLILAYKTGCKKTAAGLFVLACIYYIWWSRVRLATITKQLEKVIAQLNEIKKTTNSIDERTKKEFEHAKKQFTDILGKLNTLENFDKEQGEKIDKLLKKAADLYEQITEVKDDVNSGFSKTTAENSKQEDGIKKINDQFGNLKEQITENNNQLSLKIDMLIEMIETRSMPQKIAHEKK